MGVELRVHTFFLLLAVVCLGLGASDGIMRGLGLFLVLVVAIVVREIVRLLVAAWLGLKLRAILLLPIGGLFAYANPESQENANRGMGQFALAFAGPLANGAMALILAATFLGASGISLISQPWISSAYLLRSMVWMPAGLAVLHLPAFPVHGAAAARQFRPQTRDRSGWPCRHGHWPAAGAGGHDRRDAAA
jgi:hypothetical protein